MIIYLVRHAETFDNINMIIQGQDDSKLTPQGTLTAKKSMQFFKGEKIDKIVSSPIGRARETAFILCDTIGYDHNDIVYNNSFKEINLGLWTKMPKQRLPYNDEVYSYKIYKENPELFKPKNGESLYDLQNRVVDGYLEILEQFQNLDKLVIVSHSVAIRTLLLSIEEKPMNDIWNYCLPAASKTMITVEQGKSQLGKIGF